VIHIFCEKFVAKRMIFGEEVKRMLSKGCYSLDDIAELTNLSLADVEKLKEDQAEQA